VVLGFDPFGFRLSYDWGGGSFAYGVVNGVLKGTAFSEAFELAPPEDLLCHHTTLRACRDDAVAMVDAADTLYREIATRRCIAAQEATYLVEMQADDALRENFMENALLDPQRERKIGTQLFRRLQGMYADNDCAKSLRRAIATAIRSHSNMTDKLLLQELVQIDTSGVNWPAILRIYRASLADLCNQFGLPGQASVQQMRSTKK
jgi:hypothetical protein